jgi:hypothetical protein
MLGHCTVTLRLITKECSAATAKTYFLNFSGGHFNHRVDCSLQYYDTVRHVGGGVGVINISDALIASSSIYCRSRSVGKF